MVLPEIACYHDATENSLSNASAVAGNVWSFAAGSATAWTPLRSHRCDQHYRAPQSGLAFFREFPALRAMGARSSHERQLDLESRPPVLAGGFSPNPTALRLNKRLREIEADAAALPVYVLSVSS